MKAAPGRTAAVLDRRWLGLERLATLTLGRDRYAATPGPTVTLALGERTQYRAAAWLLDEFARADGALGVGYEPWVTPPDFGDLVLDGGVATAEVGLDSGMTARLTTHTGELPRDQWAEATLAALDAGADYAAAGVGLRLSPPNGTGRGYLALATADVSAGGGLTLTRYVGGAGTEIGSAAVPWRPGDVLRATAAWDVLRVYRNGVLILEVVDAAPLLVKGRAGLSVLRLASADAAALSAFVAGPLRQEVVGLVADMGDASQSLGLLEPTAAPMTFALTLVNLAPVGGADRLAALIRHGLNTGIGTYDLHRGDARVVSALEGGGAPLAVAAGKVIQAEGMTEDRVRLACQGRDAVLAPRIVGATPAYLSSAIPTTAPLPDDPCGADEVPVVVTGSAPTEPTPPDVPVGLGPEAPAGPGSPADTTEEDEDEGAGGGAPLAGLWIVRMRIRRGDPEAVPAEPEFVAETVAAQSPDLTTFPAYFGRTEFDLLECLNRYRPNAAFGTDFVREVIAIYQGPDKAADAFIPITTAISIDEEGMIPVCPGVQELKGHTYVVGYTNPFPAGTSWSVHAKLARYSGAGITSAASLTALLLALPSEGGDLFQHLPARVETLAEWTIGESVPIEFGNDALGNPLGFGGNGAMDTHVGAGPALFLVELIGSVSAPRGGGEDDEVGAQFLGGSTAFAPNTCAPNSLRATG